MHREYRQLTTGQMHPAQVPYELPTVGVAPSEAARPATDKLAETRLTPADFEYAPHVTEYLGGAVGRTTLELAAVSARAEDMMLPPPTGPRGYVGRHRAVKLAAQPRPAHAAKAFRPAHAQ